MSSRHATPAKPNRKGLRQCVACRGYFPAASLIRAIRHSSTPVNPLCKTVSPPISVVIPSKEATGPVSPLPNGRSAYCCTTFLCISAAIHKKQLQRTLKQPLPPMVQTQLEDLLMALKATDMGV